MRLAISDDEAAIRTQLRKKIGCGSILPCDTEIAEFSDGTALINSHALNPYDIIFLDIQMSGISGLETAHEIRKTDKNVIIIFLTSYEQYVFHTFKIQTFDYIIKPIDDDTIQDVLTRAVEKYKEQHYIIHFNWQDNAYALDVSDIVYIESYYRLVIFVTKDNKYDCIGKLDEYERRLSLYGFLRCHRNTIINMRHIKSIENTCITTNDNRSVKMSVRRKQDCLSSFNAFLARHRV